MADDFDPHQYNLAEHGDSRQRHWAKTILPEFPHYESFWRKHILPLSFRPHQPDNYFIRPTQSQALLALADASYAAFFHLAQAHEWEERLRQDQGQKRMGATEAFYCFFSHAGSMMDACLEFCDAVNGVLEKYKQDRAFHVVHDERGHPHRIDRWGEKGEIARFNRLRQRLAEYRNFLVHEKPIFVQNSVIPKPEYLEEMSGLTAISKLARNTERVREAFEPVDPVLRAFLKEMRQVCDDVWEWAEEAVDRIDSPKYREDQLKLRPEDRELTLEKIRAVRGQG